MLARASREAPSAPGVYLFLGACDEVLYVGKATRLRHRLRQHAAAGPPTSHLHRRYDLVSRVVWEVAATDEDATWREADLIFALAPPFNANPGLRSRDPLGGWRGPRSSRSPTSRPPHCGSPSTQILPARVASDGCFPHLGRGVASQLGIACSDGYAALLRLLWAASGEGSTMPAVITRSAPPSVEVGVALELRAGLHRLLSGVSPRVLDALAQDAGRRSDFMQPALARDAQAAARFFEAGPRRLRVRSSSAGSRDGSSRR